MVKKQDTMTAFSALKGLGSKATWEERNPAAAGAPQLGALFASGWGIFSVVSGKMRSPAPFSLHTLSLQDT